MKEKTNEVETNYKQVLTILISIILVGVTLGVVGAKTMYAGECQEVNLSTMKSLDNVVYDVVGNSSNLEGLNITLNETSTMASICTKINYKPDSFTIIFIDNSTKEIIKEVHHYSSGGRRTITKYEKEYIYKNITTYIDKDDKTIDDEKKDCEECIKKPNNSLIYFLIIVINALLLIGIVSTIIIKKRKPKEQEEPPEGEPPEELSEDYY